MSDTIKYLLPKAEILKDWYNLIADLQEPPPAVLRPDTHEPLDAVAS
jgi:predicted alternative tryptophan synthase beta-subunit